MNAAATLDRIMPTLRRRGIERAEVHVKRGRSRKFEIGPQGVVVTQSSEEGWAVRASSERASFFAAGSGALPDEVAWPDPDGYPLELPPARRPAEWSEPAGLEAPLLVESEGLDLLVAIERALAAEMPAATLLRAALDDGASSSELASSLGVRTAERTRGAALYLEGAVRRGGNWLRVTDLLAEREPRLLEPREVAARLADRLAVRWLGEPARRDRVPCLLAPAVAVRLLGGLLPLFLESTGAAQVALEAGGVLGSKLLTIVDDPTMASGLLAAPADGEGVPGRAVKLVEQGVRRAMLSDWRSSDPELRRPAGCARRPTWREPPRLGPSHLFIEPDPDVAASSLLAALPRGLYAIDALGPARLDFSADRLEMPTAGYAVRDGKAERPVSRALVTGRISSVLQGIQAVARDLKFFPVGALLGSPSVLVRSVEIGPG